MKLRYCALGIILFLYWGCNPQNPPISFEKSILVESFEVSPRDFVEKQNPPEGIRGGSSFYFSTEGIRSFCLQYKNTGEYLTFTINLDNFPQITSSGAFLVMDVYNDAPLEMTSEIFLKKGEEFIFLGDGNLKSGDNWNWNVPLPHIIGEGPFSMKFSIKNPAYEGFLFIDNIRIGWRDTASSSSLRDSHSAKPAVGKAEIPGIDFVTKGEVLAYSKVEFSLNIKGEYDNPYDPGQIKVDGVFVSPSGETFRVPGFYYTHFNRLVIESQEILIEGDESWRLRFAPDQPGEWSLYIVLENAGSLLKSEKLFFTVNPSVSKGRIRGGETGSPYFRFDSGDSYIPVGANVAWYDYKRSIAYHKWFHKMAVRGANFARVWLVPWAFDFEWKDTGLGYYGKRQTRMFEFDQVLNLAEENGIYMMLCLINHGRFSSTVDPEWDDNPYNKINGGPLEAPRDFLTNPSAIRLFKQKLRYIIARWGYSPNLFSWDLWNEVNLSENIIDSPAFHPWLKDITDYIRKVDYSNHLLSLSLSTMITGKELFWELTDYLQIHRYYNKNWGSYLNSVLEEVRKNTDKPVLLSEFGIQQNPSDPEGIHFHNGLWSSLFSGAAGSGMIWWWDHYIDEADLYYHYQGLSSFFKDENLFKEKLLPKKFIRNNTVEVYSLAKEDKALLWIKDKNYNYYTYSKNAMINGNGNSAYPVIKEFTFPLFDLSGGTYKVEFYDTLSGEIISSYIKRFRDNFSLKIDSFRGDIAVKLVKIDSGEEE